MTAVTSTPALCLATASSSSSASLSSSVPVPHVWSYRHVPLYLLPFLLRPSAPRLDPPPSSPSLLSPLPPPLPFFLLFLFASFCCMFHPNATSPLLFFASSSSSSLLRALCFICQPSPLLPSVSLLHFSSQCHHLLLRLPPISVPHTLSSSPFSSPRSFPSVCLVHSTNPPPGLFRSGLLEERAPSMFKGPFAVRGLVFRLILHSSKSCLDSHLLIKASVAKHLETRC